MNQNESLRRSESYFDQVAAVEPEIFDRVRSLEHEFQQIYNKQPQYIVRSPGRVELIGNHTDYNWGKAAGVTLNSSTIVGIAPNDIGTIRVYSGNVDHGHTYHEIDTYNMKKISEGRSDEWINYIQGVIEIIRARFGAEQIQGADLYIESNIPLGGGFSSSAALELAVAKSIAEVSDLDLGSKGHEELLELILLAQQAETGPYVRAKTGLLDQTTAANGGIVFIDFKPKDENHPISFEHLELNFSALGMTLVVMSDKELKHNLAASGGGYNERVLECNLALEYISRFFGRKILHLREVYDLYINTDDTVRQEALDVMMALSREQPTLGKRVKHIIQETERVDMAQQAILHSDVTLFGQLMIQSGQSALENYDIGEGCPELRWTFEKALTIPGVESVRNMGGGFNNTILLLVETAKLTEIQETIQPEYHSVFGQTRLAHLDVNPFLVSPGLGILKKNY